MQLLMVPSDLQPHPSLSQLCPSSFPFTASTGKGRFTDALSTLVRNIKGDCFATLELISGFCTADREQVRLEIPLDITWQLSYSKQSQFEQVAQDLFQTGFEHLQEHDLYNLSTCSSILLTLNSKFFLGFWLKEDSTLYLPVYEAVLAVVIFLISTSCLNQWAPKMTMRCITMKFIDHACMH